VHQPLLVVFHPYAFDVFGGLHKDAEELLQRLQGLVSQVELVHHCVVHLLWFQCKDALVILARRQWGDNWRLAYCSGRPRLEGAGDGGHSGIRYGL
jgi:hypothetical protein